MCRVNNFLEAMMLLRVYGRTPETSSALLSHEMMYGRLVQPGRTECWGTFRDY